jgi:hypothetical protein
MVSGPMVIPCYGKSRTQHSPPVRAEGSLQREPRASAKLQNCNSLTIQYYPRVAGATISPVDNLFRTAAL